MPPRSQATHINPQCPAAHSEAAFRAAADLILSAHRTTWQRTPLHTYRGGAPGRRHPHRSRPCWQPVRPEAPEIAMQLCCIEAPPPSEGTRHHRRAPSTRRPCSRCARRRWLRKLRRGYGISTPQEWLNVEHPYRNDARRRRDGRRRHPVAVRRPLWCVARSRDRVLEDGQLAEQPDGRRAAGMAEHPSNYLPRAPRGEPRREQ